jgi:hypothetical protein
MAHPPAAPDFEDDVPTGVKALPAESHLWAMGIHRAVRDIRGDIRFLIRAAKLVPLLTGAAVAIVEALSYVVKHYRP